MENFEHSKLWRATLAKREGVDDDVEARQKLRQSYLDLRTRIGNILKQIATDVPDLTVHDLTHVDALWEIADLLLGSTISSFTAAEGYLIGGAFLFHDAALSLVGFKGGLTELQSTPEWADSVTAVLLTREIPITTEILNSPPPDIFREALLGTLRLYHSQKAAELPLMSWIKPGSGENLWLIQDEELRNYYGPVIGLLAKSHWSDAWRLSSTLPPLVTPGPGMPTDWIANPLKLACILRTADAAHLDHRRAPSLLMALHKPSPDSMKYWTFQNKLGKPGLQDDAIVFSSGAFSVDEADAWWECLDALRSLDLELKRVDAVLHDRNLPRLAVKRVSGVDSPENLKRYVLTNGWTPVDAAVRVSDVQRIIEMFGGQKLYGNDPMIPVRELMQNAADAIRAKQLIRGVPATSGIIDVQLREQSGEWWLDVIDNGIGMSARVLTQVLLEFGTRFWTGNIVREEFPGLLGKGMQARGKFGIGFFSVFMLGDKVRVTTWKDGTAAQDSCTMEFRGGIGSRPILREPEPADSLSQTGTRISVCLRKPPTEPEGLLWKGKDWQGKPIIRSFSAALAALVPTLDTTINFIESGAKNTIVENSDWINIDDDSLLSRISEGTLKISIPILRPLKDSEGHIYGRAALDWNNSFFSRENGIVTIDGIKGANVRHLIGLLLGQIPETLARDAAFPIVPLSVLAQWASEQAKLLFELSKTHRLSTTSFSDDDALMRVASLVLKCGGELGELPIVRLGDNFLSTKSFSDYLKENKEFYLLAGDVDYDEDIDDVHPREFKGSFAYVDDLVRVTNDAPVFLKIGTKVWPDYLFEDGSSNPLTLEALLWKLVESIWGDFDYETVDYAVGEVDGTQITRTVKRVFIYEEV